MHKSAGEKAEKLLARNRQIKAKIYYFEMKIRKLKEQDAINRLKAEQLLKQERLERKYKVE